MPDSITGSLADIALGRQMIYAWQVHGGFHVAADADQDRRTADAIHASEHFFGMPLEFKAEHVSDLTYSGYTADYPEMFTVCKDVPIDDWRVSAGWPAHGPVPWPHEQYRRAMTAYLAGLGSLGERLLELAALGLGLTERDALTRYTVDGWHQLRLLRFPTRPARTTEGAGHGLLAIIDDANGLLSVFPGDILQFLTGGLVSATPYQIASNAMVYFHEPNFEACARPLAGHSNDYVHYGTHFTSTFMRRHPHRSTTRRILAENRLAIMRQCLV